jgi:hypothetical protein
MTSGEGPKSICWSILILTMYNLYDFDQITEYKIKLKNRRAEAHILFVLQKHLGGSGIFLVMKQRSLDLYVVYDETLVSY